MSFTSAQITSLVEITGFTYSELETVYAAGLNAAQESAVGDDIDLWETSKNKHLKLQGGAKGIFLDSEDTLRAIRARVFKHLGLSYLYSVSGSIGTLQIGN